MTPWRVAFVCLLSSSISWADRIELDSGAHLQFASTGRIVTVDFVDAAGSTFDMPGASSLLQISGNWSTSPGTFTAGVGTIEYNGSAAQAAAGVAYNNLTCSGNGTTTLEASKAVTVAGTLYLNATAKVPTLTWPATSSITVNVGGTFQTTMTTTRPGVTSAPGAGSGLQLLGVKVNVAGLAYNGNANTSGFLNIGPSGGTDTTVTTFKSVAFTNAAAGGKHLYYQAAVGLSMVGIGCSFDASFGAGSAIKCDSVGATPPFAVCVMARATGAGINSSDASGTGKVTWTYGGDQITATPGTGEVTTGDTVANPAPRTYVGVQGFMTSQYNWYNGYFIGNYLLSRQAAAGGNDVLYAVDNLGATRGSMTINQASFGNVIGPPWTATLGNAPGSAEVIMFVTTNGWIFVVQDFTTTLTSVVAAGAATLPVNSTSGFPASGTLLLGGSATPATVTYTGTTATSFTGCTGVTAQSAGAQVSLSAGMLANYTGFPVQPRDPVTYATVVTQAAYSPLLFDAGADGVANKPGDADDFFYFTGCSAAPGAATYNNAGASTNQVLRTKCFTAGAQGQCVASFPVLYGAKAAWNWPALQVLSGTTYLHIATDCDVYSGEVAANQGHIIRINASTGAIDQNYVSNLNNAALNPAPNLNRPRNHARGAMQIVTDFINPNFNYIYLGSFADGAASPDYSKFFSINTTSTSPATYKDQWAPWGDTTGNNIDSAATFGSTQIFFGDSGGLLHAISNTTGLESAPWPVTLDAGKAIRCAAVFPTVGTSNLYIGNDYGEVFQVNTNTGAIVNTFRLGDGQPGGVTRRVRTLSIFIDNANNTYVGAITSDGYEFLLGPF